MSVSLAAIFYPSIKINVCQSVFAIKSPNLNVNHSLGISRHTLRHLNSCVHIINRKGLAWLKFGETV